MKVPGVCGGNSRRLVRRKREPRVTDWMSSPREKMSAREEV